MLIAGLQKTSFVDFPGEPAAVVFTPYCNFDCGYCHNAHILKQDAALIDESVVTEYITKRAGLLHALVISGGEPTLQQNLPAFIRFARELGYRIKLDTNGTKSAVLAALLENGLLDYVAMDIKAPLSRYAEIARANVDTREIVKSIAILESSAVPHEFRMTFAPQLTPEDAGEAAKLVRGCKRFYLQQYRARSADDPAPHPPSALREAAARVRENGCPCTVRGLGADEADGPAGGNA